MPPREHYRQEPARVVRRDFTGWWQTMTIRKGSNYGITVGAPVVFAGGVIGKVSEVHLYNLGGRTDQQPPGPPGRRRRRRPREPADQLPRRSESDLRSGPRHD